MAMTMTQKILARHAGLEEVRAGQLIQAKLDLVLGNDITTPVAINEFESRGLSEGIRQEPHRAGDGPLRAEQGHQGRDAVQAVPHICAEVRHRQLLRRGRDGHRARAAAGEGTGRPRRGRHRRGLPHLHLRRAGRVLHGRRLARIWRAAMAVGQTWFKVPSAIQRGADGKAKALRQRQGRYSARSSAGSAWTGRSTSRSSSAATGSGS